MPNIVLNGKPMELEKEMSLTDLQKQLNFQAGQVAVAVNHSFVPKSQHESFIVKDGQEIEMVAPMQGG